MNTSNPRQIAIFIAAFLGGLMFISTMVLGRFSPVTEKPIVFSIVLGVLAAVAAFLLVYQVIERFIYRKIKLIYKNIHNLKRSKGAPPSISLTGDIISNVEAEVMDWEGKKTREIEDLKKLEKYREEFLANVSHELKTPIFNIRGYLDTLAEGGLDDPKINKSYLVKAIKNLNRLEQIVKDLELISRIESGMLKLEIRKFDITQLVKEVLESLEMMADLKDIKLALKEKSQSPVFVKGDRERIRQVLENLVTNSIKYGTEGGRTLVGIYDMEELILIEISDNGPGIEHRHLDRLFERFYRIEKSRSRDEGGTGLGLAIVKHIVEAHGQSLNVRSTLGVGSTFGFTLPKA